MSFQNANILSLIFNNIPLFSIKQLLDQINNTSISNIILNLLSYKKIFLSMGKAKIELKQHCTNFLTLLSKNNMFITISKYYKLRLWDIRIVSCISTVNVEHHVLTAAIELTNENIAIGTIENIIQIRSINNLNCIKTICLDEYKEIKNFSLLSNGKLACSSFNSVSFYILIFDMENEFDLVKIIKCHDWYTLRSLIYLIIDLQRDPRIVV
jgi:hypothetical protein